ncbi:MAG: hypothetical protein Kow0029_19630 [Candidatus Rifleibacteriota bacterium]
MILADYGRKRPYFWYQIGSRFGILVFINWKLVKGDFGLTKMANYLNKVHRDSFCGFVHVRNLTEINPAPPERLKKDILSALARFDNMGEQLIEQENSLMSVQMLNSKIRIFSIREKDPAVFDIKSYKMQFLTKVTAFYFIGLAIILFNFRSRRLFFSIRWKLLLLFLYANIAPLSVLGYIAYDYLQHKKIALNNDINLESARLMRDFDARFEQQKFAVNQRLNRLIKKINACNHDELDSSEQKLLKASLQPLNASEIFLFDKYGKVIFAFSSKGKDISSNVRYFKTIAHAVLKYTNKVIVKSSKVDVLSKITSPEDSDFIRNSIRDSRKIWPISIGNTMILGYWNYIGDSDNFQNNYFLLLMWSEDDFQKIYLQNHFRKFQNNFLGAAAFARSVKSKAMFPAMSSVPEELSGFMSLIEEKGTLCTARITIGRKKFIVTGMLGSKLDKTVLCTAFPEDCIEKKVAAVRSNMIYGAILSILMTSVLGLLVSTQFMEPVKDLSRAAIEINRQNYRYRMERLGQDEFGHLGAVINRVIEGLGELEIAKVVQDSLFPEDLLSVPPFEVFGKSVVMTTLGGDYFDYFVIDDDNFGVIIGDVAGHGVSAALIMAMAKARVKMTAIEQRLNPAKLNACVHSIIHSLKSRNLRRMMTFQYLVINKKTGKAIFSNAGHCYPVLVSPQQRKARFVELIGQPLGAGKHPKYRNLELEIAENESLILFTDGIVEAKNSSGEQLGYPGFIDIVIKSYHQRAEEYYNRIFSAYLEWAGEADDDTTLIVINRNSLIDEG